MLNVAFAWDIIDCDMLLQFLKFHFGIFGDYLLGIIRSGLTLLFGDDHTSKEKFW